MALGGGGSKRVAVGFREISDGEADNGIVGDALSLGVGVSDDLSGVIAARGVSGVGEKLLSDAAVDFLPGM